MWAVGWVDRNVGRHGARDIDGAPHLWFRQAHEERRMKEEERGRRRKRRAPFAVSS